MVTTRPTRWDEVPAAVRAALATPFVKGAGDNDYGGPLGVLGDVTGWRPGPLNANWGGPRPVTNLLVGAALGSLGGYGAGRLAEAFFPDGTLEPGALRKRLALAGGLGLALPALWQWHYNNGVGASGFDRFPAPAPPLPEDPALSAVVGGTAKAAESVKGSEDNNFTPLFDPMIPRDAFTAALMEDPNTPMPLRAAAAGLVEAADAVGGGRGWVSPWDVARVAVGAGVGLASGVVAGRALGALAGLSPESQKFVQRAGLWSGVVKEVVPQALGMRSLW